MSKEDTLTALREANMVRQHSNSVRLPVDDIAVMKWLEAHRRKATTMEDVEVIDVIVKRLFHQGVNKVTGRVHGERVVSPEVADAVAMPETPAPKFDKKAYMRELMRKKRAAAKA